MTLIANTSNSCPTLLTAEGVARLIGVGVEQVKSLSRCGRLPAIRVGYRTLRYDPADVAEFISRSKAK